MRFIKKIKVIDIKIKLNVYFVEFTSLMYISKFDYSTDVLIG